MKTITVVVALLLCFPLTIFAQEEGINVALSKVQDSSEEAISALNTAVQQINTGLVDLINGVNDIAVELPKAGPEEILDTAIEEAGKQTENASKGLTIAADNIYKGLSEAGMQINTASRVALMNPRAAGHAVEQAQVQTQGAAKVTDTGLEAAKVQVQKAGEKVVAKLQEVKAIVMEHNENAAEKIDGVIAKFQENIGSVIDNLGQVQSQVATALQEGAENLYIAQGNIANLPDVQNVDPEQIVNERTPFLPEEAKTNMQQGFDRKEEAASQIRNR